MCQTCGCAVTHPAMPGDAGADAGAGPGADSRADTRAVDVLVELLAANNEVAAHNSAHFDASGVLAINLM